MLKRLKKARAIVQLTGVIISSVIAALTAYSMGGDPVLGAVSGITVNGLLATIS